MALAGLKSQRGENAFSGEERGGLQVLQRLLLRRALHAPGERGELEEKGDSRMPKRPLCCDSGQAVCHPGATEQRGKEKPKLK